MRKTHRYRRLFASDLIKVDKNTKNIDYTNERARQLNMIDKLESDKPKVIREKKPVEKIIEAPQELIRSSRTNKGKRITTRFDEEDFNKG